MRARILSALAATLLIPALAPAQVAGTYTSYGTGCKGTGGSGNVCHSHNATETTNRTTTLVPNREFVLEVTAPSVLLVTGFQILSKANLAMTLSTKIYLDNNGKPDATPVRTGGTMQVGTNSAWNTTSFPGTPLIVKPQQKFYIGFTSQSGLYAISSSGTNTVHYWNGPPSWSGPWNTQPWAWKILCIGSSGAVPQLGNTGVPVINKTFQVDLTLAAWNTGAILVTGSSRLNIDLTSAGAAGCTLLASLELFLPVATSATGTASVTLPVPNDTGLINKLFDQQFIVVDSGANSLGLVFTNGGEGKVGG